jgi:hypothetical protein
MCLVFFGLKDFGMGVVSITLVEDEIVLNRPLSGQTRWARREWFEARACGHKKSPAWSRALFSSGARQKR